MKSDADIVVERVQSEALGALMSIQSHRAIDPTYFDGLRAAVIEAADFFKDETEIPPALTAELHSAARVLRNEAISFPGRTAACVEMANWLDKKAMEISDS